MRKELIEELIKQAQEDGDAIYYYNPAFAKRLVELTVKECAETLKKDMELAHIQLIPLDFKMYANGRLQRTIEEHLGVKL